MHVVIPLLIRVFVQPIGERRSTKAEARVLHFDLNVGAIQLVDKETLRQTIRLDVVNQLIYDQSGWYCCAALVTPRPSFDCLYQNYTNLLLTVSALQSVLFVHQGGCLVRKHGENEGHCTMLHAWHNDCGCWHVGSMLASCLGNGLAKLSAHHSTQCVVCT